MENLDGGSAYIASYVSRARAAQREFETYSQGQIDRAVQTIAKVVFDNAEMLARLAVEETGMGNCDDKAQKNRNKARLIWNNLRGKPSVGIIERDEATGISKVAKPVGVVAAITPCTNPIVTPMSNSMFALKGANAIIITPHHRAVKCSGLTVELINKELSKLGYPDNLVQILDEHSRENTKNLISSADVVIATGGMGMVKAAYSSGKPALGVGAGNVQCIVSESADLDAAAPLIVTGRAYDNGIICAAEQSAIIPESIYEEALAALERHGAFVVRDSNRREALRGAIFSEGAMNRHAIGREARQIAALAGFEIPETARVIAVPADSHGAADSFSKEKMCPVLAVFRARDFAHAVEIARENLEAEGKGHSVSIHGSNREEIEYAALRLPVSRFVLNQCCASAAGGSFFNGLAPTNTLGCGSWGNNSISENLDYKHLINISRIAEYRPDNPVPDDGELWKDLT